MSLDEADHAAALANLTATQIRCNELLEEARAARRAVAGLEDLVAVAGELGPDERRVLLVLARRLLTGQRTYGLLRAATDGRDWLRERSEELADVLVYTAIAEVAATGRGGGVR